MTMSPDSNLGQQAHTEFDHDAGDWVPKEVRSRSREEKQRLRLRLRLRPQCNAELHHCIATLHE